MNLRLHNYWRSSASHRVRIGLHLKQLPFEYVAVHILENQQFKPEYLASNPMGVVPTLELTEDDGTVRTLVQSLPILEYLEERWPQPAILPADPYLRAKCRALAEIINSGIQPLQNLSVTRKLTDHGVDAGPWIREWAAKGLNAYARAAAETAGQFSVGDWPSIADCCLVPQLASARRFKVEIESPLLRGIEERCLALPAFAAAMPANQPDAVKS
ncbi:MAG TPA: maleylacetoacetate isomerase [Kofleriaceae bacterium]|jgi:maleylpyruvate isomerase